VKLGELMRNTRKDAKLSQQYISQVSGVSEQRLSRIERDFTDVYAYELPLIAKAYGLDMVDVLDAVNRTGRVFR